MTVNLLGFILFMSIGVVFAIVAIIIQHSNKKTLKRCTRLTKGKVVRFTYWDNNGVNFPVVEYVVNNVKYKQTLNYAAVVRKSASVNPVNTTLESDSNGDNLVIRANSRVSRNPLKDCFPVGTEMDVYYDPQKPKKSYVMRFRKNPCGLIFLCVGLGFIALAFVLLMLLPGTAIA